MEVKQEFGKELIPINEVCKWLGIDKRTMLKQKQFTPTQIGNRWYITAVALARGLS